MPTRLRVPWCLLAVMLATASCGERASQGGGANGGTVVMSVPGDAGSLLPPFAYDQIAREVSDQLFDRLAEIGPGLNTIGDAGFQPRLARSWTWSKDSLSIAFALDPRARWHDGQPVRSSDVRFSFALNKDSATGSVITPYITSIDSVTTPDSLTAVVWFKRRSPEQFYDATFQVFILPEHVLGGTPHAQLATSELARHPIGSGRFRFVRWDPGVRIEIEADSANYRGRARLDRVIWSLAPDGSTAATQLFSGQSDYLDALNVDLAPRVDSSPTLRIVRYPGLQYAILGLNLNDPVRKNAPHPVLGDVRVRRAIAMALDRRAMLRNVFDTLGTLGAGPFPRAIGATSVVLPPFDRAHAAALLDSAGWALAPNGVRSRNSRPLHFSIIVPNSSRPRMRYAVLIQEQLKAVGVDAGIDVVAFPEFMARQQARSFDANINSVGTDPSPATVRLAWTAEGMKPGGQNYVGYNDPAFDAEIDSAIASFDRARGQQFYRRAYQRLVDDAPAVFLYEPLSMAGVHRRLRTEGMRAGEWWASLADWWIPANERIDRDRIGLRAAAAPPPASRP
jgi:peptide/nickel transport system substrate-binding protein